MRDIIAIAVPGPSVPQTAAEPLPAARTLLQQSEQPDQPLQHRLPADASGLAATIRGPLAPELYDLLTDSSSTATASSSSATPQTSTSASADAGTAPSTSASTAPSTSASADATPSTSTAAATVSRTTAWRRKLQEEKERRARELGEHLKPARKVSQFNCRRCGQPKTREFGHTRYKKETFCSRADDKGRTVEQWLAEVKGQR